MGTVNTKLVIPDLVSSRPVGFSESYRPDAAGITFRVIATRSIDKYIVAITIVINDRRVVNDCCVPAPVYIIVIDMP